MRGHGEQTKIFALSRRQEKINGGRDLPYEVDRDFTIDVTAFARFPKKAPDGFAAAFSIIAGEFVHVHPDKFGRKIAIHVWRVPHRVLHRLGSMSHSAFDAIAQNRPD